MFSVPGITFQAFLVCFLATVLAQPSSECILSKTTCQCSEERVSGYSCLKLDGNSPGPKDGDLSACVTGYCENPMICDCNGFETCSIATCSVYEAYEGYLLATAPTIPCVLRGGATKARNSTWKPTAEVPAGKCVEPISSSRTAAIKSTKAAGRAANYTKHLDRESADIYRYIDSISRIVPRYYSDLSGLRNILNSPEVSQDVRDQVESLVAALESLVDETGFDLSAAAEAREAIASHNRTSNAKYKLAVSMDKGIVKMRKYVADKEEERKEIIANEGPTSTSLLYLDDEQYRNRDKLAFDESMVIEHRYDAVSEARLARVEIRKLRMGYVVSGQHRNDADNLMKTIAELIPKQSNPGPPGSVDSPMPGSDMTAPRPDMTPPIPDMNAPRPDMTAPRPDTDALRPNPDTPRPDTDAPRPDTGAPGPNPDAPGPNPDAPRPDPEALRPDSDTPSPNSEVPRPNPDAPGPDAGAPSPDSDATRPETNAPRPDSDAPRPEQDDPRPETDAPRPDLDAPRPDAETLSPNTDAPRPNAEAPRPDAEDPMSDPDAPRPNQDAPRPNQDAPRPGTDATMPEADAPRPNPDAPRPDPDTLRPDAEALNPNTDAPRPDSASAVPDLDSPRLLDPRPKPDASRPAPDAPTPDPAATRPGDSSSPPETEQPTPFKLDQAATNPEE